MSGRQEAACLATFFCNNFQFHSATHSKDFLLYPPKETEKGKNDSGLLSYVKSQCNLKFREFPGVIQRLAG